MTGRNDSFPAGLLPARLGAICDTEGREVGFVELLHEEELPIRAVIKDDRWQQVGDALSEGKIVFGMDGVLHINLPTERLRLSANIHGASDGELHLVPNQKGLDKAKAAEMWCNAFADADACSSISELLDLAPNET